MITGATDPATNAATTSSWISNLPQLDSPQILPNKPAPAKTDAIALPEPAKPEEQIKDPVKETVKPAGATVDDEKDEKWPRNAQDWKSFKQAAKEREAALAKERDDARAERDRMNGEIATLSKQGPSPELEALRKERDELSETLRVTSVEKHPKFQAYFGAKVGEQVALAKQMLSGENAATMEKIIALPAGANKIEQIKSFISNLGDEFERTAATGIAKDIIKIDAERESAVKNSQSDYEKMQAQEKATATQRQQENVAKLNAAFDDALKSFGNNPVYQKRDNDPEWNKAVDSRIAQAKSLIFDRHNPDVIAKAALYATSLPTLIEIAKAKDAEVTELRAQVKALTVATPGGGAASERGGSQEHKMGEIKTGMTPMRQSEQWAKDMAKLMQG